LKKINNSTDDYFLAEINENQFQWDFDRSFGIFQMNIMLLFFRELIYWTQEKWIEILSLFITCHAWILSSKIDIFLFSNFETYKCSIFTWKNQISKEDGIKIYKCDGKCFWIFQLLILGNKLINFVYNITSNVSNVPSIVKLKKGNVFVQKMQKQKNSHEEAIMSVHFSISSSELVSLNEEEKNERFIQSIETKR
jgi:fucose 4-O-acetylase-like acetyltransferase